MHTLTPSTVPAGGAGHLEIGLEDLVGLTLVRLQGPLDIYTVPDFRDRVDGRVRPGARIVVDLTNVTILDSCGLGALVRVRNRAEGDATLWFGLICPRRRIRRIFDITGLRPAFVMERDLVGVLRAWRPGDAG